MSSRLLTEVKWRDTITYSLLLPLLSSMKVVLEVDEDDESTEVDEVDDVDPGVEFLLVTNQIYEASCDTRLLQLFGQ